jgi:hypothetical protein
MYLRLAPPASAMSAQRACHALALPRRTVAERAPCAWCRRLCFCCLHHHHGCRHGHHDRVRRHRAHCQRVRRGRRHRVHRRRVHRLHRPPPSSSRSFALCPSRLSDVVAPSLPHSLSSGWAGGARPGFVRAPATGDGARVARAHGSAACTCCMDPAVHDPAVACCLALVAVSRPRGCASARMRARARMRAWEHARGCARMLGACCGLDPLLRRGS